MILDEPLKKRVITFKLGTLILFLLLVVALIIGLGFIMICFAAQAAPAGDPVFHAIWKTADFLLFQTLSIGVLCFLAGVLSKYFQFNWALSTVVAGTAIISIILYAIWALQTGNNGVLIRGFN